MPPKQWVLVETIPSSLQAELLRGLLEAQGIQVLLSQEGAGKALGLNVAPLGEVNILVPNGDLDKAKSVLEAFYTGYFQEGTEPYGF